MEDPWLSYFLSDQLSALFLQLACECYSRLPSLGAGFSQGLKHTENWEQELHSLLASLHSLLGTLYEGTETGRDFVVRRQMGFHGLWQEGTGGWSREAGQWVLGHLG